MEALKGQKNALKLLGAIKGGRDALKSCVEVLKGDEI